MAKKAKKKTKQPVKAVKTVKPEMEVFNLGLADKRIKEKFKKIIPLLKELYPDEKITQPRAIELLIEIFHKKPNSDMPNIKPGQVIVDEKTFDEIKTVYESVWNDDISLEENIFACINFERNAFLESNKKLNDSATESKSLKSELLETANQLDTVKKELAELKAKPAIIPVAIPLQDSEIEIISLKEKLKKAQDDYTALNEVKDDLQRLYDEKKHEYEQATDNALQLVDPQFIAEFDEELTLRALNNKSRIIKLGAIDQDIEPDEYPGALCVVATDFYLTSIETMYAKKK